MGSITGPQLAAKVLNYRQKIEPSNSQIINEKKKNDNKMDIIKRWNIWKRAIQKVYPSHWAWDTRLAHKEFFWITLVILDIFLFFSFFWLLGWKFVQLAFFLVLLLFTFLVTCFTHSYRKCVTVSIAFCLYYFKLSLHKKKTNNKAMVSLLLPEDQAEAGVAHRRMGYQVILVDPDWVTRQEEPDKRK